MSNDPVDANERSEEQPNDGRMLVDATACPQDIAYPTDLGLLNAGRMKCEEIIYILYDPFLHGPVKPRTYREKARKTYLNTATNSVKLNPGDRNPIEGKFGQAKVRYGMDRIKARLKDTSKSWVAMILVVMNLVRMTREAPYFWLRSAVSRMGDILQGIIRENHTDRMQMPILFRFQLKLIQ